MKFDIGTIPIPDTYWKVETIKGYADFITLGNIAVPGSLVKEEMEKHTSIKGYEPYNIAQKLAEKKFPKANPIIVSQIIIPSWMLKRR